MTTASFTTSSCEVCGRSYTTQTGHFCKTENKLVVLNVVDKIVLLVGDVREEAIKAVNNWPTHNSAHESLAVLEEEVSELRRWVYTKQGDRDLQAMKKEALQVAACAVRFMAEICNEERGRR